MKSFPWQQHLSLNNDPNWQVKTFSDALLNIMSNFVPHTKKKCIPRDPPWISKSLKTMLKRKNRLYKNYKKNGYKLQDKDRLEKFRNDCQEAVESAKHNYILNLGNKLNDTNTTPKAYWKIINRVMNKCRAPRIPPILNPICVGLFGPPICVEGGNIFPPYLKSAIHAQWRWGFA